MLNLDSIGTLPVVTAKSEAAVAGRERLLVALWPVNLLTRMGFQMFAKGVGIDLNALARVPEEALLAELVHLERHDFARRADVLRNDLMGERRNFHGAILGPGPQAISEAE